MSMWPSLFICKGAARAVSFLPRTRTSAVATVTSRNASSSNLPPSTSSPRLTPDKPEKQPPYRSFIEKLKRFFASHEFENFEEENVKRAHAWDKMSETEWTIIYRDASASRTFIVMALAIPFTVAAFLFFVWDIAVHERRERAGIVQRLSNDARQLGVFIVLPSVAAVVITVVLLRVHSLRMLRIYENRKVPEEYVAVVCRGLITQHKMRFNRMDAAASYFEHDNDLLRIAMLFSFGNLQIGRSRYVMDDNAFRANNYRTYMVNETSVPPRL